MMEDYLPREKYIGLLDQTEVVNLPPDQKKDMKRIEEARETSNPPAVYTKPELHKLISLHDFEEVARKTLTPKGWAFYSSAATDLVTLHNNSEFYQRIMFRPRVMRNVVKAKTQTTILGCPSDAPFFVSPAAMARLAHRDGELAIAQGCANEGIIQCVNPSSIFDSATPTSPNHPL